MNNQLKHVKKAAQEIRMSEAEKSAMRFALDRAMAEGKAVVGAPSPMSVTRSPYVFTSFFSYQTRMVMAGLLLFVLVGAGTASAAQGALPGDVLYPIKVRVTERVEVALAGNTAAKAAVETKLAARRVEEAEALAAAGKLDVAAGESIAANFDAHVDAARALADEADAGSPGTAAEVKATLASSLQVHGEILSRLGGASDNGPTKESSKVLAVRIIARAQGPARVAEAGRVFAADASHSKQAAFAVSDPAVHSSVEASSSQAMTFAASAPDERSQSDLAHIMKGAVMFKSKAAASLAEAKKVFEGRKSRLASTTAEQLQKEFAAADIYISAGAAMLESGDYEAAAESFGEAVRIGVRLRTLMQADEKLDRGIIPSLLAPLETSLKGEVKSQ